MNIPDKPLIMNQWKATPSQIPVINPFDRSVFHKVETADGDIFYEAVKAASETFPKSRKLTVWQRSQILSNTSCLIEKNSETLARIICCEAGKPIGESRKEVERSAVTFRQAAAEVLTWKDDLLPLDIQKDAPNRIGLVKSFPIGPVLAITPFNFPLNLVAHKIAPAIAAGCTAVLKPASKTPMTALFLGRLLMESGMPAGMVNIVPCSASIVQDAIEKSNFPYITFTGSSDVGWNLKSKAGRSKTALELGGNAAAILEPDTDLDFAVNRCAVGGYAFAGQICISLQRIYVHESLLDSFLERFKKKIEKICVGNPISEDTGMGPMIEEEAAKKIEKWINQSVESGSTLITGGRRSSSFLSPTILTGVKNDDPLQNQEVFAPLTVVESYHSFDEAIELVNNSKYGLQAGIFTSDWNKIWKAFNEIHVGGVIINDVPTIRVDSYPYGGLKESGLGREGVRYAMEEMMELKVLVLPG